MGGWIKERKENERMMDESGDEGRMTVEGCKVGGVVMTGEQMNGVTADKLGAGWRDGRWVG